MTRSTHTPYMQHFLKGGSGCKELGGSPYFYTYSKMMQKWILHVVNELHFFFKQKLKKLRDTLCAGAQFSSGLKV